MMPTVTYASLCFASLLLSIQAEEIISTRVTESLSSLSKPLNIKQEGLICASIDQNTQTIETIGHLKVNGPEISSNTLFEIGSITKVFTGIALADAILQGSADLNDPITKFFPKDFAPPESPLHLITLKQLATHTSGLPRLPKNLSIGSNLENPYAHYDEEQLLHELRDLTSKKIGPKNEFSYSNFGAGLLGYLLARINECSYPDLIAKLIFRPLKMENTFVSTSPDSIPKSHRRQLAQGHAEGKAVSSWHFTSLAGAGAIVSTAQDLLLFAKAHWLPTTPEPLRKAMAIAAQPHFASRGLGWHINGHKLSHTGGTGGFRSYLEINRTHKTAFLTLQNGFSSGNERLQTGDFTPIQGLWSGTLATPSQLPLFLNILPNGSAVLYSLDQGASPIFSGTAHYSDQKLEMYFPIIGGSFHAHLQNDQLIGTWTQGQPLKLTMNRTQSLPKKLKKTLHQRFPNNLEPLQGYWFGEIATARLFVYLEIQPIASQHEVLFFTPTQHPQPLSLSELKFDKEKVSFQVPSVNGSFSGKLNNDKTITGHWNQGIPLALTLKHTNEKPTSP